MDAPGFFVDLRALKYGDQVRIHAWGDVYTYQVAVNCRVSPLAPKAVLEHTGADWITLFTCESNGEYWGDYGYRRTVQAVLEDVIPEYWNSEGSQKNLALKNARLFLWNTQQRS